MPPNIMEDMICILILYGLSHELVQHSGSNMLNGHHIHLFEIFMEDAMNPLPQKHYHQQSVTNTTQPQTIPTHTHTPTHNTYAYNNNTVTSPTNNYYNNTQVINIINNNIVILLVEQKYNIYNDVMVQ
eukprot:262910_1